ncbi:MAG: insulinase family protein [Acidobacteriota bacterium]|nr:insulinase family protein [Acidobacteriota bacterium]
MNENIRKTKLENGLTILTEKMPGVRSATIGFWIKSGSRHEPEHLNGICHFIEHSVFKGTNRRTALDIAIESDKLGGNFDAFTSHEVVGFTMKVVDKYAAQAFDLLADMLANPRFDQTELKREQKVIIEEMKMVEDTPEEYLGELFNRAFFPAHSLGLPIEGTRQTVKTFNHETTAAFHAQIFTPANIVISAAGNIEHAQIAELAEKFFNKKSTENLQSASRNPQLAAPILLKKKRELEQAHLIIAAPFVQSNSPQRYAANLLTNILGGGTASRLWQAVREERGLAYSVGASAIAFADCGIFSIYAGTSPKHLDQVVDLSIAEMRRVVREGVSPDELELVKEQGIASILLGLESTSVRAGNLARQEIVHGKTIPIEETLVNIEAVTTDDIQAVAREFFQTERIALAALGNLNGFKVERSRLEVN